MAISKQELEQKILAAKSADEVAELAKAAGQEISAEEAARIFEGVKTAQEKADKQLDVDELSAVAGGGLSTFSISTRDYIAEGCAATVEYGSDCIATDGGCFFMNIEYTPKLLNRKCPTCGVWLCQYYGKAYCKACRHYYPINEGVGT